MLTGGARAQTLVALSSCEAEFNAALKGGRELQEVGQLLQEWGREMPLVLKGDSSACEGVLSREGVGRLKHIEVKQLWLQQQIGERKIGFDKIPRTINSADCFTKHWTPDTFSHFHRLGFYALSEGGGQWINESWLWCGES